MGAKYGPYFQKEFRHYTILQRKLLGSLHLGSKLLIAIRAKTPLQHQLIPLIELLSELNRSTVRCFQEGHTASGLLLLRQVQDIAHKIIAMYLKPSLAKKKKVTPSEAREVLRDNNYSDWSELYKQLCSIAHSNNQFLFHFYPIIMVRQKVSEESRMITEYFLMALNLLNQKAISIIFDSVKKPLGSDYDQLLQKYRDTLQIVNDDFKKVRRKNIAMFGK